MWVATGGTSFKFYIFPFFIFFHFLYFYSPFLAILGLSIEKQSKFKEMKNYIIMRIYSHIQYKI